MEEQAAPCASGSDLRNEQDTASVGMLRWSRVEVMRPPRADDEFTASFTASTFGLRLCMSLRAVSLLHL